MQQGYFILQLLKIIVGKIYHCIENCSMFKSLNWGGVPADTLNSTRQDKKIICNICKTKNKIWDSLVS